MGTEVLGLSILRGAIQMIISTKWCEICQRSEWFQLMLLDDGGLVWICGCGQQVAYNTKQDVMDSYIQDLINNGIVPDGEINV